MTRTITCVTYGLLALVILFNPIDGSAQFGIGGRYSSISDGYWQEVFNDGYSDQLGSIYGMYWFRLKKKRVEFLPEIGYYHSFNTSSLQPGLTPDLQAFYLQFNTDIYFFDFGSDCNCPTFSKQGDLLQRGFFVEVSPGIEFRKLGMDYLDGNVLSRRIFKTTVPKIYGGLGFDIGASDLITVTPYAGVTYAFNTAWDGVEEFLDVDPGPLNQEGRDRDFLFNAGIRVLLRPDYLRGRRR